MKSNTRESKLVDTIIELTSTYPGLSRKEKTMIAVRAVVSALAVGTVFLLGTSLGTYNCNNNWQQKLLDEGYGEFNKKTGEWQLCEPEVVLLNHNTAAINILNGGIVTIKDYLAIVETDLKRAQDRVEEQAKELIDQDLLLDKYKKNIKIPGESSVESKKSGKKPLTIIDVNKMF